ncbi:MAG: ketose-bisphosphate aldolase [Erysipelotrichales bacterium]|nr:ketose-bisphosphate aldolase [Erysipelotrichales bacterium]
MLMNMKELLKVAKKENFAVPAFNISSYAMFLGVMRAAEKENSPVIIEIHPHELAFTGDSFTAAIRDYLFKSPLPCVLHLDHGASVDDVMRAIQDGFTSVMIDGSSLPFEENIALCRKVCDLAHAVNVSVEGELGTIGVTTSKEAYDAQKIIYTDPEDAKILVEKSGLDSLAVAIGTSHGLYPKGAVPKLRLDILEKIAEAVDVPLVLHGGSNNPDEEIAGAVVRGINKINISSDIKAAFYDALREKLQDPKLREPNKIEPCGIDAVEKVAAHKIRLFRSSGKASLY